ncbi:phage major capsid protein [Paenibacillus sp. TRM 82003]|nr:phage major capsid protein [Paenibacillus sp. TRM 82003]
MKRIKEIEQRKLEIRTILEGEGEVDLTALETELRDLDEEKKGIEKRKAMLDGISEDKIETRKVEDTIMEHGKVDVETRAKMGQDLLEKRAVTVASTGVILPKHQATDIKPTFEQVSSLIDLVNAKDLPGGETFEQPYQVSNPDGDYTGEGANYTTTDPVWGKAVVSKTKITAYSEISEELEKLPAANYANEVVQGMTTSVRKKLAKEILVGDGTTGHLIGIFDDGATAIDAATDLAVSAITNSTLDDIIYGFGGDEAVEDQAVLILNKKDLKAFAALRDGNGNKVHTIVNRGNTGTIDGIPYVINSVCKSVATATAGQYCMAYGPLSNYMLAVFSPIDVQKSTDYKFQQGMVAHRASVFVGGNVVAKNGFLRVKKSV